MNSYHSILSVHLTRGGIDQTSISVRRPLQAYTAPLEGSLRPSEETEANEMASGVSLAKITSESVSFNAAFPGSRWVIMPLPTFSCSFVPAVGDRLNRVTNNTELMSRLYPICTRSISPLRRAISCKVRFWPARKTQNGKFLRGIHL